MAKRRIDWEAANKRDKARFDADLASSENLEATRLADRELQAHEDRELLRATLRARGLTDKNRLMLASWLLWLLQGPGKTLSPKCRAVLADIRIRVGLARGSLSDPGAKRKARHYAGMRGAPRPKTARVPFLSDPSLLPKLPPKRTPSDKS